MAARRVRPKSPSSLHSRARGWRPVNSASPIRFRAFADGVPSATPTLGRPIMNFRVSNCRMGLRSMYLPRRNQRPSRVTTKHAGPAHVHHRNFPCAAATQKW